MTETSSYNMTDELRIIEFAIKKEKKKLRCGVFSGPAGERHLEKWSCYRGN